MDLTHLDQAPRHSVRLGHLQAAWTDLGSAAGAAGVGVSRIELEAGAWSTPAHKHGREEEIFVILDGAGTLLLGSEEIPVTSGHVIARPAATGVAHAFRAGDTSLRYLAYGTREPGDLCYYPRSQKIVFRGLGVIGRIEPLAYWDGED